MSEELTQWAIQVAAENGITVKSRQRSPNDGEVIHFNIPRDMSDPSKKNPYFMIWTESRTKPDFTWHMEFGHWYYPKNAKESKQFPTTYGGWGNNKDLLRAGIEDVANRIGT